MEAWREGSEEGGRTRGEGREAEEKGKGMGGEISPSRSFLKVGAYVGTCVPRRLFK